MAAGLGFKTFTTGEVLTAADTNGYLMQGVLVFASAAARDAAITSPQEGQCCYLKDTDAVLTYSGAAWVGFDDSNAIQNTQLTAKGALITAFSSATPATLTVGNNGETLVADSSTSTGLRYGANFAAGKNAIINGAFNVWQRGTSVSLTTNTTAFGPDRFSALCTFSAGTASYAQQTFTPGTAPVSGYEGQYFSRITCGSTSTYTEFGQKIENVQTYAGQTITFSFWAKSSASIVFTPYLIQNFGSGGSANTNTTASNITLTSSWTRYTMQFAAPALTGKTIGTSSYLKIEMDYVSGTLNSATIDTWGWQLEAGSVATAFQTATGTIQGELAACSRYYQFAYGGFMGLVTNAAYYGAGVTFAVPMRTTPTVARVSDYAVLNFNTPYVETPADTGFMAAAQASSSASNYFRTKYSASAEL
jgi:hypothetical protein